MKGKALFLDRDGIFNEVVHREGVLSSPHHWGEVRHYEGLTKLSEIRELGYKLILVSNQPDIERGYVTQSFVEELNQYYQLRYQLDKIYYCPFASPSHPDKKPNPGMFRKASLDLDLELSQCFHLGDTEKDVKAALRSGCKSILWERTYNVSLMADYRVKNLREIHQLLEGV